MGLSVPTLGGPNQAHPTVDSSNVVINEWLSSGNVRFEDDFVELYNASEFPADIGGHFVSDRPFAIPAMSEIAQLSFIGAKGFRTLIADASDRGDSSRLAFRISPELEQLGLFTSDLERVDIVFSAPQTSDISVGRVPDGASRFGFRSIPTPNASNGTQNIVEFGFGMNRVTTHPGRTWEQSGESLPTMILHGRLVEDYLVCREVSLELTFRQKSNLATPRSTSEGHSILMTT